jgi:hypothetical protein
MIDQTNLADNFTRPGTSITVNRMRYGAMQLADEMARWQQAGMGALRTISTERLLFCERSSQVA